MIVPVASTVTRDWKTPWGSSQRAVPNALTSSEKSVGFGNGFATTWSKGSGYRNQFERNLNQCPPNVSSSLRKVNQLCFAGHAQRLSEIVAPSGCGKSKVQPELQSKNLKKGIVRQYDDQRLPAGVESQSSAPGLEADLGRSDLSAKPLVVLDEAKRLLGRQRIQVARATLQSGATSFAGDGRISALLKAISPGRARRSKRPGGIAGGELDWLRKHGHKYRGLWVAISGTQLVASAKTLDELNRKMGEVNESSELPLIHKVVPF